MPGDGASNGVDGDPVALGERAKTEEHESERDDEAGWLISAGGAVALAGVFILLLAVEIIQRGMVA